MKIKRFFAQDMRRAIAEVRSEHGPDAVIVSSRSVDGGVEIVSAVDYDQSLMAQIVGQETPVADSVTAEVPVPVPQPDTAGAAVPAGTVTLEGMQRELTALRQVLSEQFADIRHLQPAQGPVLSAVPTRLQRQVAALGLGAALTAELLQEAAPAGGGEGAWQQVLGCLARRIAVVEQDPIEAGGVLALVGPTGVGKTTTIAKLAARHCLRYGPDSLQLVSTDNYRIGAQRQLEAFGAILGVPVQRASDAETLGRLLAQAQGVRLTLIDTAGLAPRDARLAAALRQLENVPSLKTFLVLPANLQRSVLAEAARRFAGAGLAGAVLTKLDEADGLGAALSVLIEQQLPVAWLSEGQRVPEDLKQARPLHLVSWAAVPPELGDEEPPLPELHDVSVSDRSMDEVSHAL